MRSAILPLRTKLILIGLYRFFGSFGAFIAIIALGIGPFAQQVATYRTRVIWTTDAATIPMALNYTGVLPGDSSGSRCSPLLGLPGLPLIWD